MKRLSFTTNNEKLRLTIHVEVRYLYQLRSTAMRTYTPLSSLSDLSITLMKGKRICSIPLELSKPEIFREGNSFDRYPINKSLEIISTLHKDTSSGIIVDKKKAKLKLRATKRGTVYGTSQKSIGKYEMRLDEIANEIGFEKIKIREEEITLEGFPGYLDVKIITKLETLDATADDSSDGSDNSDLSDISTVDITTCQSSTNLDDKSTPSRRKSIDDARNSLNATGDLSDEGEAAPVAEAATEAGCIPKTGMVAIAEAGCNIPKAGIAEIPSYLEDAKEKATTATTAAATSAAAAVEPRKGEKPSFLDEMRKKAAARENAPPAKLSFLEELAKKPKKVVQLVEPAVAVSKESSIIKSVVKKDESAHKSKRVGFASESPSTITVVPKPSPATITAPAHPAALPIQNGNDPYIYETAAILRRQLKEHGIIPLEFIPLDVIKKEMESLIAACNTGAAYDEDRLDHLIRCMDYNPEHQREKEEAARQWRREIQPLIDESLESMKGFVPPHIFHASVGTLAEVDNMSKDLIKRLTTKKCLWLVRIPSEDIEKMHEAELLSRFNPLAQNLDIIELAAVYGSLPAKFSSDSSGKKEKWRASIEETLKAMNVQRLAGSLPPNKLRNPAYSKEDQLYMHRRTMHRMKAVKSEEVGVNRKSFLNIKGSRAKQQQEFQDAAAATAKEIFDEGSSKSTPPTKMKLDGAHSSGELNRWLSRSSENGSSDSIADNAEAAPTKMKLDGAHISGELNRLLSRSPGSENGSDNNADAVVSAMKQQGGARPANKPSFLEEIAKKKGAKKDSSSSSSSQGSDSPDSNGARPPAKPLSFLEELAKKKKKEPSVAQDDAEPSTATALPTAKPSFLEELKKKKKGGDPAEEPQSSSNDTASSTSTTAAPRRPSFLEELANKKKAVDG